MIIPSGHSKAMRQSVSEQSGHALEEIRHEMESQLLKHFSDVRVNQEMGLRFTTSTEKESFLNLTSPIWPNKTSKQLKKYEGLPKCFKTQSHCVHGTTLETDC